MLIDGVVGRSTVANMRMGYQTNRLENFECSVNRRKVHSRSGVLNLDQDFLGGSVTEVLDGLQHELPLRRYTKTVLPESLLPILGHR
jgi:hypothetical protein